MSDKRLFDIWAWSQIESAADGSVRGESRERMRRAQDRDARLRGAIARARALNGALRAGGRERPPPGLLGALLAIPQRYPRGVVFVARDAARGPAWATAGGAVAAAVLAAIVVAGITAPYLSTLPRASVAAQLPAPPIDAPSSPLTDAPSAPPTAAQSAPAAPDTDAAQDFAIALAYLNKSAAITGREIGAALNDGLTAALEVSRESLSRRSD